MLDQLPPRTPARPSAPRPPAPFRRDLQRLGTATSRLGGRLHRRWGWRLYAVPLLLVVTIAALTTGGGSQTSDESADPAPSATAAGGAAPPAARDETIKTDDTGVGAQQEVLASDALPPGAPYTQRGAGTFHVVPGTGPEAGTGNLYRYTVEVEDGVTGVDEAAFGKTVQTVLADPRSWVGRAGQGALQRVDSGPVSWRVTLTSSLTVRDTCGYEIQVETSCWNPTDRRVYLNVARWVRGDVAYIGDLDAYRTYMVNHENGHALGHEHVMSCLPGGSAPVMMQQTITTTATDGTICQPNPWPNPPGVALGPDPRGESAPAVG
ncbi:DUF3152 domain-containing protein [Jatrophihabitans sp. YIM 134969]